MDVLISIFQTWYCYWVQKIAFPVYKQLLMPVLSFTESVVHLPFEHKLTQLVLWHIKAVPCHPFNLSIMIQLETDVFPFPFSSKTATHI